MFRTIDQIRKMTAAAMQIAEKKVRAIGRRG
jgi:hypothetical protein